MERTRRIELTDTDRELLITALGEKAWSAQREGNQQAAQNYRDLLAKIKAAFKTTPLAWDKPSISIGR